VTRSVRRKSAGRALKSRDKRRDSAAAASPQSNVRRDLVLDEILRHAAKLFARKGYSGTSLQDVADSVGLQRTSLYYYFDTKEALLSEMIREVTVAAAQRNKRLRSAGDRSATDRLFDMVYDSVIRILEHPEQLRLLDRIESELPESLAATYLQSKRTVRDEMIRAIDDGIESGELVNVDSRVAAFALIGMANWTAWWFQSGKGLDGAQVAELIARLAVRALAREASGPMKTTAHGIIDGIRAELGRLEAVVGDAARAPARTEK
jgi:AcrR family transcriptional regulator